MPGSGLFALFDDVASLMDDVAMMAKAQTKVAGAIAEKTGEALGKTAGVVGDDVALGAETLRVTEQEQRIGLMAKRELAIVWKVAKGSALNKLWISAAAIGLSASAPWALTGLLALGGAYLCKEGAEKVIHAAQAKWGRAHAQGEESAEEPAPLDPKALMAWEESKIRGAVRTDMVLSGEIILISLGGLSALPIVGQAAGLAAIGAAMTVGVYGSVAALVKLDDVGLALAKAGRRRKSDRLVKVGEKLMVAMPSVMKGLTVLGVAAMLGVGGTIMAHNLLPGALHAAEAVPGALGWLASTGLTAGLGLAVGAAIEAGGSLGPVQRAQEKIASWARRIVRRPKPALDDLDDDPLDALGEPSTKAQIQSSATPAVDPLPQEPIAQPTQPSSRKRLKP